MVSEQLQISRGSAVDRKGKSDMNQGKGSCNLKDSCSPPKQAETQREHDMKVLASRLEEDLACVLGTTPLDVWYIDSGASVHMTGVQECFLSYQEEQMNFQITMGNKGKCTPIGRGAITFQTEDGHKI